MIDNELLEIDRSFNSYKGTIVIPRLCENNCVLFLCFNSYKGTIVINSIISKIYLLISFNSYKGTIVI